MNPFERMKTAQIMDVSEPLSKAIAELGRSGTCVVVTKDGEYQGIVDDRSMERMTSDPSSTRLGAVVEKAPIVPSDSSILQVCKFFFAGPYKHLPVQEGRRVVGVISRNDVLASLLSIGALQGRVRDFMTTPVVTVEESASLAQARARMRDMNVRRAIVMKGERMQGLLSTYDLRQRTAIPFEKPPFVREKIPVESPQLSSVMRSAEEVVTVSPESTLAEAAQRMVENGVGALVVVENGKPIGFLSARDVFESVMFRERAPVYLSGLDYADRMHVEEIQEEVERELEKIRKSFDIDYLALHFKRYEGGRKHSVHARLKTNKFGVVAVSNHGFDMMGVVHGVMKELKKIMLQKVKIDPMKRRGRKPFRGV